jgi:hypothetical protein
MTSHPTGTVGAVTLWVLMRLAVLHSLFDVASDALMWGLKEGTFLPPAVINDAISFVYDQGDTLVCLEMYEQLYQANKVQHWSDVQAREMDLHTYSKGMAFAAIRCAIDEVSWWCKCL